MDEPVNVNTELSDRSINRATLLRAYEQKSVKKVALVIDGHAVRVDKLMKESKLQGKDFNTFLRELDKEIVSTMKMANSTSSNELEKVYKNQSSWTTKSLHDTIGDVFRVKAPPRHIAEEVVNESSIWNNKTLSQSWTGIGKHERVRIEAIIRKGIAEGKSEKEITKDVFNNAYKVTKNQAQALVVTATTHVYSQADHQVYMANKTALKGYQYVAVLDSRTTPLCSSLDGKTFPVEDKTHLPPQHIFCRSSTLPIVLSYDKLASLENVAQVRKRNLQNLTPEQIKYYDGQSPLKESYNEWLKRQPTEVQLKHLGDTKKLEAFRQGQLNISQMATPSGDSIDSQDVNLKVQSTMGAPGDTRRFAFAKEKLDTLKLGAARPEEIYEDQSIRNNLKEYYILQAGELDGNLSFTNYRGTLLHNKRATRNRVLTSPPREDQLVYNPLTNRYQDSRMYQPNPQVFENSRRLVTESELLKDKDKEFINKFIDELEPHMSMNERSAVTENLRVTIERFRKDSQPWNNLKAVLNNEMKFDVMNVSNYMETQLRKDADLLAKLKQLDYIDPMLGPTQLKTLSDEYIPNIMAKNRWEDKTAIEVGKELRNVLDRKIPLKIRSRLKETEIQAFYTSFAKRLGFSDTPDRDQLAVQLGRDLYNKANFRGSRNEWHNLGVKILDDAKGKGFYELETYGVQKRRMKSKIGGRYFGPYYDTFSVNVRVVDPRLVEYARLVRKTDLGYRIGVTAANPRNRLVIREGYKTYFIDNGALGYVDTRIPITSTSSFTDFPASAIDKDMADALNWAAKAEYRVDPDFHDFVIKLLDFQDDKGKAAFYNDLNVYRTHIVERGDSYERMKAMQWFRETGAAFSNHPFLDHRARIYDSGLIGPQSGETFRPFLSTSYSKPLGERGFLNLQDQIGAFLGGESDKLEGKFNSLTVNGRQSIAAMHRAEMIKLGDHMRRAKPNDIRAVLESPLMAELDGEEQGKLMRLALEMSKINEHLGGNFNNLSRMNAYKTALALEQDASSSGAQIIALTTKNKQLAELSNVIPTDYKKRLYDEIAASTFNDPRFIELNKRLNLTEKDLRKAAKQQNMVTLYGAGQRTGMLAVEAKVGKVLDAKDGLLVVKASERDAVLDQISARMARYEKIDPEMYQELRALRQDVKDTFNKGLSPGEEMLDQLYFLDPKSREFVEKLTRRYDQVVTPQDFTDIAHIMSEKLAEQVPILQTYTKTLGKLAQEYMLNAKPKQSALDYGALLKTQLLGAKRRGAKLPAPINRILGIKDEAIRDKLLKRIPGYVPGSLTDEILTGVAPAKRRRTGFKIGKFSVFSEDITKGREIGIANKLEKNWTNVPWVNFDGVILEQNYTQRFDQKLMYKDKDGNWITNIIQVDQRTDPTWWEEIRNKQGKINDIADDIRVRTAYGVSGNHSNDATLVKQWHLWGKKNKVPTSTVHDAFFTNAGDMLDGRDALRQIMARAVDSQSIESTLKEMRKRGLPKEIYDRYLEQAKDEGLIPVPGRSVVGGKILKEEDILTKPMVLEPVKHDFKSNRYFYGVG